MGHRFYTLLAELLEAHESVAVATVIATRGSVPREVSAKMLVKRSGEILGTVGGGCGEAQVWRTALQVVETGQPAVEFVDLTDEISMDSAAVCGGTMDVLVERWGGDLDLELAKSIACDGRLHEPVVLATVVSAQGHGAHLRGARVLVDKSGRVRGGLGTPELDSALREKCVALLEAGGPLSSQAELPAGGNGEAKPDSIGLYLEMLKPEPRIAILGAGHIAIPLAQMAALLGFEIAVLDDRRDFANRDRFPDADVVLAQGFSEGIRHLAIDQYTYVVLITRGHQHDVECLLELGDADPAYLGMIGSRRRVQAVLELLGAQGVAPEKLLRIHAPIGIDIGAKTPAEIALSILAEIVNVRRGGKAASLSAQ